jgi:hypothetical protein
MTRWIGVLILFVLLCAEIVAHGPLTLRPPATILSNAARVQKETEPYLLFLGWVAPRVPSGSKLAIRTPDALWYFIALGQLPDQVVVPATGERGPLGADADAGGDAEWVACYFANLDDPRFRRVESYVPNGSLYRRLR